MATTTTATTSLQPGVVQATATVHIIAGVRLKLDSPTNRGAPRAHQTVVRVGGPRRPARLIEFQ